MIENKYIILTPKLWLLELQKIWSSRLNESDISVHPVTKMRSTQGNMKCATIILRLGFEQVVVERP